MTLVNVTDNGLVEVRWMFLPVFIGQNIPLMKQLESVLSTEFKGKSNTIESRDVMERFLLQWLTDKYKMPGLHKYLEAVKYIEEA